MWIEKDVQEDSFQKTLCVSATPPSLPLPSLYLAVVQVLESSWLVVTRVECHCNIGCGSKLKDRNKCRDERGKEVHEK